MRASSSPHFTHRVRRRTGLGGAHFPPLTPRHLLLITILLYPTLLDAQPPLFNLFPTLPTIPTPPPLPQLPPLFPPSPSSPTTPVFDCHRLHPLYCCSSPRVRYSCPQLCQAAWMCGGNGNGGGGAQPRPPPPPPPMPAPAGAVAPTMSVLQPGAVRPEQPVPAPVNLAKAVAPLAFPQSPLDWYSVQGLRPPQPGPQPNAGAPIPSPQTSWSIDSSGASGGGGGWSQTGATSQGTYQGRPEPAPPPPQPPQPQPLPPGLVLPPTDVAEAKGPAVPGTGDGPVEEGGDYDGRMEELPNGPGTAPTPSPTPATPQPSSTLFPMILPWTLPTFPPFPPLVPTTTIAPSTPQTTNSSFPTLIPWTPPPLPSATQAPGIDFGPASGPSPPSITQFTKNGAVDGEIRARQRPPIAIQLPSSRGMLPPPEMGPNLGGQGELEAIGANPTVGQPQQGPFQPQSGLIQQERGSNQPKTASNFGGQGELEAIGADPTGGQPQPGPFRPQSGLISPEHTSNLPKTAANFGRDDELEAMGAKAGPFRPQSGLIPPEHASNQPQMGSNRPPPAGIRVPSTDISPPDPPPLIEMVGPFSIQRATGNSGEEGMNKGISTGNSPEPSVNQGAHMPAGVPNPPTPPQMSRTLLPKRPESGLVPASTTAIHVPSAVISPSDGLSEGSTRSIAPEIRAVDLPLLPEEARTGVKMVSLVMRPSAAGPHAFGNASNGAFGDKFNGVVDRFFSRETIDALKAAAQRPATAPPQAIPMISKGIAASGGSSQPCGVAPHFVPCVPAEQASRKLLDCCRQKSLPVGCLPLCRYDVTQADVKRAFDSGRCGLFNVVPYLQCASQGRNNLDCCRTRGVATRSGPQCEAFCHPADGLPPLGLHHLTCQNVLGDLLQCHHSGVRE